MIRYYSIIGALQVFCLYHIYKNHRESYWYFVVLFIPALGSLAYLYVEFFTRNNIEKVSESIKNVVNPEYSIQNLLKEAKYSDTITNKEKLADAYASKGQYHQAIALYKSCLEGFNEADSGILTKLMVAQYFVDDYQGVVVAGSKLDGDPVFDKSESQAVYAWSLYHVGQHEKADEVFESMDVRYSHYVQRSEYAKYLIETNRSDQAKDLLSSLIDEFEGMDKTELRQKKAIRKEIEGLMKEVGR